MADVRTMLYFRPASDVACTRNIDIIDRNKAHARNVPSSERSYYDNTHYHY